MPILQKIISSRHFEELAAEERIEPRGEFRADLRNGILCATVVNCWRGKGTARAKPSDFMPRFDKPQTRDQTPEEMMAAMRAWTRLLGGEVVGG